jgi:hypothetical protein
MTRDEENNKHIDDEVAVTEVSAEVLEELSHLFGPSKSDATTGGQNSADEISETIEETVDGPSVDSLGHTSAIAKDVTPMAEVISIIVEPGLEPDLTPAPADPLLTPMSRSGDVMEAVDDRGGTLVIVDDDMDRVVIVDEDRPDPRFEERQRRHKRRERLQKVKWFKLALGISVVVVVVLGVLASPLFAIQKVVFEGNVYTSLQTIEEVTELLNGASVFTADTRAARERVLEDPWVSEVRITTDFPGSALVEVAERVPVVWYVGEDQQARMIDARGFIIAVLEGWPTKYLQVTGTGASLGAGSYADDVYRAAAQLVLALPDELRGRVKSLEVAGGGELSMILKEGTIVRFGPPTDLQNKLVAVVVLFRRQDPATLLVVDVSTGNPTVQVK